MSKYDIVPPPFRKKKQDDQKIDESYLVKYGKEPNIYNDTEAEMDTLKSKFKSKMKAVNKFNPANLMICRWDNE